MTYTKLVNGEVVELTPQEITDFEARLSAAEAAKNQPVIPVPASITRRQCALQLHAMQYITLQQALDMVRTAAVPGPIAGIFDQMVATGAWTPEQRTLAEIDFAANNYYFDNPLIDMMGLTPEAKAQFFIEAFAR